MLWSNEVAVTLYFDKRYIDDRGRHVIRSPRHRRLCPVYANSQDRLDERVRRQQRGRLSNWHNTHSSIGWRRRTRVVQRGDGTLAVQAPGEAGRPNSWTSPSSRRASGAIRTSHLFHLLRGLARRRPGFRPSTMKQMVRRGSSRSLAERRANEQGVMALTPM